MTGNATVRQFFGVEAEVVVGFRQSIKGAGVDGLDGVGCTTLQQSNLCRDEDRLSEVGFMDIGGVQVGNASVRQCDSFFP